MESMEKFHEFGGSITVDVLESHLDSLLTPDTLYIMMTRKEGRVRNEVNKVFGNVRYVVIDVDGERHKYDADALIALLERFEVS